MELSQLGEKKMAIFAVIVGNCDEFLYLGGNEQSTHEYISKKLGKETVDMNTYGQSKGSHRNYSTNWQLTARDLMTPDEVAMLDNRYALLFIRSERPVIDLKYDIMRHPNIALSTDGGGEPYVHKRETRSIASLQFPTDLLDTLKNASFETGREEDGLIILTEEEIEKVLEDNQNGKNQKLIHQKQH